MNTLSDQDRLIIETDANILYVCGPGHGALAIIAHAYLEGTYSELFPNIEQNERGLRQFFRQFSTPGGNPSHVGNGFQQYIRKPMVLFSIVRIN